MEGLQGASSKFVKRTIRYARVARKKVVVFQTSINYIEQKRYGIIMLTIRVLLN